MHSYAQPFNYIVSLSRSLCLALYVDQLSAQVMAIATLAELTDNQRVFRGVVKIRKGLGARLMLAVKDMSALKVRNTFFAHTLSLSDSFILFVAILCLLSNPITFRLIHVPLRLVPHAIFLIPLFSLGYRRAALHVLADVVPRLWPADSRQAARGGRLDEAHSRAAGLAG